MFENINDAKNILRTRTSKIIGGYLTEFLFIEKYRNKYPGNALTQGWWGGNEHSKNKELTFFVVKNQLSDLDKKIKNNLSSNGYMCKQLICNNNTWYVCDDSSKMTINDYIEDRGLNKSTHTNNVPKVIREDDYIELCIKKYEQLDIIRELANSIYIENHFLNAYYTISNIDLIREDENGTPVFIEIKFKNEFKNGNKLVFGVDKYQYDNLFIPFLRSGMYVENIVLYNDVKNSKNINTTAIFEFLNIKNNQDLIWKFKRIVLDEHYDTYTFNTGRTTWNGAGERTVYCIPLKDYRDYFKYTLAPNLSNLFPEGGWGVCGQCNQEKVIRKNRESREFMGCLGYTKH